MRALVKVAVLLAAGVLGAAGCTSSEAGLAGACESGACVTPAVCRPGEASAQFRHQTPPPSLVHPWERAAVSLTFANCSGQTWTREAFALRPALVTDLKTWSIARVALPADVRDGEQVTVPFDVIAPATTGAFPFSWAVEHEGVETFEEASTPVTVRVSSAADCTAPGPPARFRMQVPPGEFVATGAPVHASVTFANCDVDTWLRSNVQLASRGTPDDAWGPRTFALPLDVPSQREVTIPIEVTAPRVPGRYQFAWQLQRDGVWMTEPAPSVISTVLDAADCPYGAPPARFLSQQAPGSLLQNDSASASARFGNCGAAVWDAGYTLDSALGGRARPWTAGPIALALPVGHGFAIDIPFQIRAPGNPGVYPYRFGITAPDGTVLDEPTPPLDVTVRCRPQCGDHNCGGDGCGGSCGNCPGGWSCDGAHCQPPVGGGYYLPWSCGVRHLCTQGNNGDICGSNAGDHVRTSAYAWDFAMGRGTEIRASRAGTVTLSANVVAPGQRCYDGCSQPFGSAAFWQCCNSCIGIANHVNVDHGDGTVAIYYHLDKATAREGSHVNAGDLLGYSGTSGCSSGPHLHFMIMGNCPRGYCQSQSISFLEAGKPSCGQTLTSKNCP